MKGLKVKETISDDEFDAILVNILSKKIGSQLLVIPGIYEILAEEFNNEILATWEIEREWRRR